MTQENTKSPNDKLADLVIKSLEAENLVPQDKVKEIENKIALGTARQEDWRLWVEINLPELIGGNRDE